MKWFKPIPRCSKCNGLLTEHKQAYEHDGDFYCRNCYFTLKAGSSKTGKQRAKQRPDEPMIKR